MSFAGLLSIEDTLANLKLKPWWETWRDYCFKASLALVFVASFFPPLEFNCLPTSDVRNEPLVLEDSQFTTVNSYCNHKSIPWHIRFGDFLALGASIFTFVLTNYWVHWTGAKKKLTDMSVIGRSILELNITAAEMKNSCIFPITADSEDKHRILRRNILMLFRRFRDSPTHEHKITNIRKVYIHRCVFVLVWTAICSSLVLYASINQAASGNLIVTCEIPNDLLQLKTGNSSNILTCVDKTSSFISFLQLGFGVFVALQSMAMIAALYFVVASLRRYRPTSLPMSDQNHDYNNQKHDCNNLIRSAIFLIVMMGIDEGQAKNIVSFCSFVSTSKDFVDRMMERTDEAIVANDMEYFRILKYRIPDDEFWNHLILACNNVLLDGENNKPETDGEPLDADFTVHNCLCTLYEPTDHIFENEQFRDFGINLIDRRHWHLLSCYPDTDYDGFQRISINELDMEGRNIIYYMLRKSTMNRILGGYITFNNFLKKRQTNDRLLVHFDGKSILAESFFQLEYPGGFRGTLPDFRVGEIENEIDDCIGELSDISSPFNNEEKKYLSSILNGLKLKSICHSADATLIIEKAVSNDHWEVIVALLNTYIVVQSNEARPKDHELIGTDWFNLRSSGKLSQIFREALKRPREKTFYVVTAAEHIMSIMDGNELSSIVGYIDEMTLPDATKDYLRDFARNRNEGRLQ